MTRTAQAHLNASGQTHSSDGTGNSSAMPIAVIGMGCRLAGTATSPQKLWQMLTRGQSGWSRGDNARFKMDSFYHPSKEMRGAINTRGLYLLKQDVSHFDHQFFHVSPLEAQAIDPQQRLLLEVAYEAFENAGMSVESLASSETGVYCALSNHDYEKIQGRDPEFSPNHRFTGTGTALASNRISYHFDLNGPSITIDTACSGSLVAVHEACKALRSGEIDQAIVCGTNLILDPEEIAVMSSMQVLSNDGRCYSFDSRANGFGRGEGVAAIVLKALSDAMRDGDPIQSVIRATAVNQDGQTSSVIMPSQVAQVRMINRAYADAGLDPRETCYVEAHGTGTQVGDKIEAGAILKTFCRDRASDSPLYVGSVKTNIGHTEPTAGLAGLLKSVMILDSGKIPPNLNFSHSNESIPLHDWQIKIPRNVLPWPENHVRRASVNSFGYGGTNAHVILEAPEDYLAPHSQLRANHRHAPTNGTTNGVKPMNGTPMNGTPVNETSVNGTSVNETLVNETPVNEISGNEILVNGTSVNGISANGISVNKTSMNETPVDKTLVNETPVHQPSDCDSPKNRELKLLHTRENADQAFQKRRLFVFTHATERGMSAMAKNFKQYLQTRAQGESHILDSLAYTLAMRRSCFAFRVAVSATNLTELLDALEAVFKGTIRPQKALENPKICFAFTGQGAQWARMGQELLSAYPLFAASMGTAEQQLASLGADWSLLKELSRKPGESRINEAAISQPCCTAIQLALVDLLQSWGIRPTVVCGHSSGEIAAAYAAGFLSDHDALSVAFFRGQAVEKLKTRYRELDGGMMAVGLSAEQVQYYISKNASNDPFVKVVVACVNSSTSLTLSGDKSVLQLIRTDLEKDGVFNRLLAVDVAYHSHHMGLVRKEYLEMMKGLRPLQSSNSIRMISSVTGEETHGEAMNAEYWAENMVSTVRFSEALEDALTLSDEDINGSRSTVNTILEIGPHSALAGPIKQTLKTIAHNSAKVSYHSMLSRDVDAVKTAVDVGGDLFTLGYKVSFNSINDPNNILDKRTLTNMPVYNWQHSTSHWSESRISTQFRLRQFARHDLLGVPSNDSIPTEPTWRNYLSLSELPWLNGHVINNQVIFPASGHICMALEALRQMTVTSGRLWKNVICRFRRIVIGRALLIPENSRVETFFTIRRYASTTQESSSTWKEFQVFSISNTGEDTEHCRGLVCVENRDAKDEIEASQEDLYHMETTRKVFEDAQKTCRRTINVEKYYSDLKSVGMSYTGPFSNLTQISTQPLKSLCTVTIPETRSSMPGGYQQPHVLHPSTLDMCFQTAFPALMASIKMGSSLVISGIEELNISSNISSEPGKCLLAHCTIQPFGRSKYRATIAVGDSDLKQPSLIGVRGLDANSTYHLSNTSRQSQKHNLCHRLEWGLDTTCAKQDDVNELCRIGLEPHPTMERRNTFDCYIRHVIQQVLSVITGKDEASMATHHRKFVDWMRSQERGPIAKVDPKLRENVQSLGPDGKMLVHVGDHLVDILTGKMDPLTVMMKDDLLYQFYAMENIQRCHTELANYLRQLQFKNPHMRILEVGAGTASMSIIALEALTGDPKTRRAGKEKFDKYVFTDISSGFFEKGKATLADWGELVEFKKLDIEKSVEEQGFEEGCYDLVIASNVLHATRSMSKTMQNVRSLLKPQGKLALVEVTETHMFWHMTVGILPGWWLGAEDGRIDSPLLALPEWDNLLHDTGFSGIDAKMKDYESVHEHQVSLIISTAKAQIESVHQPAIEIVCSDKENSIADAFYRLVKTANQQRQIRQSSLDQADYSDKICVVLLEILAPFLRSCKEIEFQKLKSMFGQAKGILWVTRGGAIEATEPEMSVITGLARTLRSENHALNIITLDLDPKTENLADMAQHVFEIFGQAFRPRSEDGYFREFEYAIRNDKILIPRVVEDGPLESHVRNIVNDLEPALGPLNQPGHSLGLEIQTPGILDSLYWTDRTNHNRKPTSNEVRIEVNMVALNFKDLMNAMGQLPGLSAMLIECSGIVVEVGNAINGEFKVGDRVCAVYPDGVATRSNIDYRQVQRIPDGMSLELATAIPVSYATALYALRDVARIKKGDSILIHAAAGALGQAAIAVAQYSQAGEIFVTVGSPEKRALIKKNFRISDENIFSSRTLSFGQGIQRRTNGRGVDVVLNSLSGDATRESQNCLAQFGRFVEVGKKDLLSNARMETQYLEKNATFSAVDLGMVAQHMPLKFQEILGTVIDLIHTQKLQAVLPITLFPISELETAFRQMQTGKHVGKLVLQIDHDSQVKVRHAPPPPTKLKDDQTYLVVGGLGGIGRALVRHLAGLGAKHIATLSRSGVNNESKSALVREMREAGVNLIIQQGSVTEIGDIKKLKDLVGKRTIRGIIQGAMVLQDSIMSNMTHAQWQKTLEPKVTGTLNLHSVFDYALDFFILLSSVSGIVGSHGQGNYSAGSTFQDAFAHFLSSKNHPVCTIDLCVVDSEGYAAGNQVAAKHAMRYGAGFISMEELFALTDHAISYPLASNSRTAQVLVGTNPADPTSGSEESAAQRPDPRFSHIWKTSSRQSTTDAGTSELDLCAALLATTTQEVAVQTILTAFKEKLSRLLGVAAEEINPGQPVSSYGMDSLIAVELRNWLLKQLESYVETIELMSPLLIRDLARLMAERSRLVPAGLFSKKDE